MRTQSSYSSSASLLKGCAQDCFGSKLELQLVLPHVSMACRLWSDICKELSRIDKVFNSDNPVSEVAVLNGSKTEIEPSEELKDALNLCEAYLIKTKKIFNIDKDGKLDFGGFIKGYAMQKIAKLILAAKVKDAFVNFGGSIIWAIGKQPYCPNWCFTLENPETEDEIAFFELGNEVLAISHDDSRYCCIRGKDPLECKILSLAYLQASPSQRMDMGYNFKGVEPQYFDL